MPPGSGTAIQGQQVYAQKCASCHGDNGEGKPGNPRLIEPQPYVGGKVPPTVGNFWPYAPPIYGYIYRAMPWDSPQTLTPDEVYAVTAFLLQRHNIVGESDRLDAQTLPKVRMPNQAAFTTADPRKDVVGPKVDVPKP